MIFHTDPLLISFLLSNFLLMILSFNSVSSETTTPIVPISLKAANIDPQDLEVFKRNLLKTMGLESRPKPRMKRKVKVPDYFLNIFETLHQASMEQPDLEGSLNEFMESDTVRSFDAEESFLDGHLFLTFNLTDFPASESINDIQLRLNPCQLNISQPVSLLRRLNVFDLPNPSELSVRRLLDTKPLHLSTDCNDLTAFRFDIRPAFQHISAPTILSSSTSSAEFSYPTITLEVELINNDGQAVPLNSNDHNYSNNRNARFTTEDEHGSQHAEISSPRSPHKEKLMQLEIENEKMPSPLRPEDVDEKEKELQVSLIVYSSDNTLNRSGRQKRAQQDAKGAKKPVNRKESSTRHSNSKRKHSLCRRHSIYIDFKELNWQDWIIAPAGYEAFFCSGKCSWPMIEGFNTTNHAIVQSLINSVSPSVVPQPCCVPTELNFMSMLYLDFNGRLVIKNYPDMIVEGCGCR